MPDFRHLAETEVHRGHIWRVVVAEFESPDGVRFQRDIVRSPGAVAVVPITLDADQRPIVTLVRQYRPPYGQELIEIPAGMRDVPGEPTEETGPLLRARRQRVRTLSRVALAQFPAIMILCRGDSVKETTMARRVTIAVLVALAPLCALPPLQALSKDTADKLEAARYVYIASTRKDGSLGKPEYPNMVRAAWEKHWAWPAVQQASYKQ